MCLILIKIRYVQPILTRLQRKYWQDALKQRAHQRQTTCH